MRTSLFGTILKEAIRRNTSNNRPIRTSEGIKRTHQIGTLFKVAVRWNASHNRSVIAFQSVERTGYGTGREFAIGSLTAHERSIGAFLDFLFVSKSNICKIHQKKQNIIYNEYTTLLLLLRTVVHATGQVAKSQLGGTRPTKLESGH